MNPWRKAELPRTQTYTLHFDGSCRPNPGPMGIGYEIAAGGIPVVRVGALVGPGTNNEAEYQALIHALRHALRLGLWTLAVWSDSLLVVNQLRGAWRVKARRLWRLNREASMLLDLFSGPVPIRHTPREGNGAADELSRLLTYAEPDLPRPEKSTRALHDWQAAAINVWWHGRAVRSAGLLSRIFGITPVQVEQIVNGISYKSASFAGLPTYEPTLTCPTPLGDTVDLSSPA
jgi:ribonuclease HI